MKSTENKKVVLGLKAFPPKSYEGFDLDRLAIYTLLALEEKNIPLYFDFASVGLFKLFPKKFSMANFGQYPDTNRISKALRRLTDPKRKRWATGTIEHAFHMTDLGREVARQTLGILKNPELQKVKKVVISRSRGKSFDEDVREIRNTETFRKWEKDANSITNHEIFAFLKAAPYTPKELLAEHLKKLKASADESSDKVVKEFLVWIEKKFNSLFD